MCNYYYIICIIYYILNYVRVKYGQYERGLHAHYYTSCNYSTYECAHEPIIIKYALLKAGSPVKIRRSRLPRSSRGPLGPPSLSGVTWPPLGRVQVPSRSDLPGSTRKSS
jgi:hypothetical protein